MGSYAIPTVPAAGPPGRSLRRQGHLQYAPALAEGARVPGAPIGLGDRVVVEQGEDVRSAASFLGEFPTLWMDYY
jgi:hypothetical protein